MTSLSWLEQSALGHFMCDSSLWTYPFVNLLRILGVASLFGATLIIDLRLLGMWNRVPLVFLTDTAGQIAKAGFATAAFTGIGLPATKATEYYGNPYLLIKLAAIALGLVNVLVLSRSTAWGARHDPSRKDHRRLAVMGAISLT